MNIAKPWMPASANWTKLPFRFRACGFRLGALASEQSGALNLKPSAIFTCREANRKDQQAQQVYVQIPCDELYVEPRERDIARLSCGYFGGCHRTPVMLGDLMQGPEHVVPVAHAYMGVHRKTPVTATSEYYAQVLRLVY